MSTLYDYLGTSLLTMYLLAPYRSLGLNSRTPGICPPSPRHPPRHRSWSRLGYTQALTAAAISATLPTPPPMTTNLANAPSAGMSAVVVMIPLLRLLKKHIPVCPKGGDFIAGRVQTAMAIAHHACVCHGSGSDPRQPLWVEWDRKRPEPLLLVSKGIFLSSLRVNTDFIDQSVRLPLIFMSFFVARR